MKIRNRIKRFLFGSGPRGSSLPLGKGLVPDPKKKCITIANAVITTNAPLDFGDDDTQVNYVNCYIEHKE